MATTRTTKNVESKMTPTQLRKENETLKERVKLLEEDTSHCDMCDLTKKKEKFYVCTDPLIKSGVTRICAECAKNIACRQDKNGDLHEPTKDSVKEALYYLDKPFIESLWTSSIQESENMVTGKRKHNVWSSYIKNVQMKNYVGMKYSDSDMFKEKIIYEDEKSTEQIVEEHAGMDTYDDYLKNKDDVRRLLSYDPFEEESVGDQPFLYSQLLGLLDQNGDENDDMMRISSCITIVRGFLQTSKIDNTIAQLMGDYHNVEKNSATIKSLQDSKQKITSMITSLAAESCISLKNNKNAKKGENTWTGKIKKVKELGLREGEVNGFDVNTCKGMRQVMEMSDASILKQLALDESEWSDMVAEQRKLLRKYQDERDAYQEISRILLRENIDLKDYLADNDISIDNDLINLDELYSKFFDKKSEVTVDDESESRADDSTDNIS